MGTPPATALSMVMCAGGRALRWSSLLPLSLVGCTLAPAGPGLGDGATDGHAEADTAAETMPGSTGGGGPHGEDTGDTGPGAGTASEPPLKLDVGVPDQPQPASGCTKVDFLFVIGSSASVRHHQDNLAASFPGFIQAIEETLGGADDIHIMVADTDEDHIAICEQYCGFGSPICSGYACGEADEAWGACDRAYGSGVRHPLGWNASNADCGFATGDRFVTMDQPDLAETFACAARVGTSTNAEWQLRALATAVSPEALAGDGCNAGFLRDDALLVVTLISDEPDGYSGETLEHWRDAVVAAKGGDAEAVVMLGILPPDVADPAGLCQRADADYPKPAPDLHAFVGMFPRATVGDVCAADYAPFLAEAVALIDVACEEFVPVG